MSISLFRFRRCCCALAPVRSGALTGFTAILLTVGYAASAQQSPAPAQMVQPEARPPAQVLQPTAPQASAPGEPETTQAAGITEEELKQMLVGKALFLRGGYLDNALSFDEHGRIIGHSPQGSYALSAFQIDRVRLTKHKVELEGGRYGLHFVGQLAYEDPTKAVDRVRITSKKKTVKITIDREIVVKPKKKKDGGKKAGTFAPAAAPASEAAEMSEADAKSVTTTTLPAHAAQVLKDALDQIFAQGLDVRMLAAMPEFWKLYYQAVADRADYRPRDPAILRQNTVDKKARLLTTFEPDSNEFAQTNGVAGVALYHTVVGADGKPQEIVVGRPIGFGLDENAVAAIRKASFDPALKDGKPVPVLLDLVVQFRIFSQRTAEHREGEPANKVAAPVLPGPYSLSRP